MSVTERKPAIEPFVISRVFDAPRELVFKAFTDPERMKHWWGPKGFKVIAQNMDLRPGGMYHYGLEAPDGNTMWGRFVYREIAAPERIVFVNSFSDEKGGLTRHPMSPGLADRNAVDVSFRRCRRGPNQTDGDMGPDQRDRRGVRDVRQRPPEHDWWLDGHDGPAGCISRKPQKSGRPRSDFNSDATENGSG